MWGGVNSNLTMNSPSNINADSNFSLEVQGCGIQEINGTYTVSGKMNDANKYVKTSMWKGKFATFSMYRHQYEDGRKRWYICRMDEEGSPSDYFYSSDNFGDNENKDPSTVAWTRVHQFGQEPAPKVTIKPYGFPIASTLQTRPKTKRTKAQVTLPSADLPQDQPNRTQQVAAPTFTFQPLPQAVATPSPSLTEILSKLNAGAKLNGGAIGSGADEEYFRTADLEDELSSASEEEIDDTRTKPKRQGIARSFASKTSSSIEGYESWRGFMDKLLDSNVGEYINLPMIAVMGDTSSGKSSLLSNISLVELPSSDTLTTKCPIRLQMRYAEKKQATVKVVWKDKPKGTDESIDFPPRTVGEDNWGFITTFISKAQGHIIAKSGKEVARDMVCVDMQGPHCENLTLIDLPGIVRSTGKGESETLSEDIKSLMNDYLKNERCVILAVHPCNVDFHNSQIFYEARKVDKDTKRTFPVLTKPDLIDDGAEGSVHQLLHGEKTEEFSMGFHMIKGRGQKDLNEKVTIEDGLVKEDSFFRNNEPWRNTRDKSKFGTKNLRIKLADVQMKIITSSFPTIKAEMQEKLDDAVFELNSLGEIPTNDVEKNALFRRIRENILNGFSSESTDKRGVRPSARFHKASKDYQSALNSSKLANVSKIEVGTKVLAIVDGEEVQDEVCYVDGAKEKGDVEEKTGKIYLKKKAISQTGYSAKGLKHGKPGQVSVGRAGEVIIEREDGSFDLLKPIKRSLVRSNPRWISELIEKNRPFGLPIFLNQEVFNAIVSDQIDKEWTPPSMELIDRTADLVLEAAEIFFEELDCINSLPALADHLIEISTEVVKSIKDEAKREVEKLINREKKPYTQNHYLFENVSRLRSEQLMREVMSTLEAHCGTGTDKREVAPDSLRVDVTSVFERNQRKSIDEHMAEEMQHALNAYGKVAMKRFYDNIPIICIDILQTYPRRMNDILSDVSDEEISRLVAAPPDVVTRMAYLKEEIKTLEKGINTIKGLSRGTFDV